MNIRKNSKIPWSQLKLVTDAYFFAKKKKRSCNYDFIYRIQIKASHNSIEKRYVEITWCGRSNIMASSMSGVSRGAKRRTVTGRSGVASGHAVVENENGLAPSRNREEGRDSGLSSESSTPTTGSPVTRQRKTTSKSITIANPTSIPRATIYTGR